MNKKQLAVVTGASSGVGLEVANELLGQGCAVIGVSTSWRGEPIGGDFVPVTGDVALSSTWDTVSSLINDRTDCELSKLVINAARLVVGSALEVSDDQFREVFEVNVFGAISALRSCAPHMISQGHGSIVFVASTDALFAEQDLAAYCTSKGALIQLMRSFAVDYARFGIRTNAVCPGAIDTPFFRQHVDAADDPEAFLRTKTARHPSGRILEARDVSSAISYLLSDLARGINGTTLVIDGGLTATFDYDPS